MGNTPIKKTKREIVDEQIAAAVKEKDAQIAAIVKEKNEKIDAQQIQLDALVKQMVQLNSVNKSRALEMQRDEDGTWRSELFEVEDREGVKSTW